ncbi:NADPH-dependent F420 reductase [Plantactinospora sp. S1510]|uniref:NADPH-dependent F420 reductase n=1 Tax=Plantactinospora alkalitolerans TaxID=2789879 RepID=A0ABS0H2U0_9ACTN|nr:NADPH-dependent F420 reductase [Plantactinospora alkalitolerans]MBF9132775.1 NADPH-dependent F420 reductase [Plantactinospora alkalitolerans]
MRIGIVGSGHVGGTLARLFGKAGHEVAVANSRGPETLRGLVDELDGQVRAATVEEAARFGDVVVVAVPFGRYAGLPADPLSGKIVIDAGNYYPERDGHYPELDEDRTTSSELLQRHLGGARVVKAFNTMRWDHLREYGRQSSAMQRYGMPVSGDDVDAKRRVSDLIEQIGFEPVDAGGLADGRRQQPGSPIYGADLTGGELHERLGAP